MPEPEVDPSDVLELRIHGINNTSPAGMLDLPETSIEQVSGDSLGSFWRVRPEALARLKPGTRGYVPDGIVREGYSWGGLARNSVGSATRVGKVVAALARVGWSLLLPFGLVNVAYWSRRLIAHPDGTSCPTSGAVSRTGTGASTLRMAGLLLTLLLTTTLATVSLDLVGIQCYADAAHPCAKLPSWVDFLGGWPVPRRLALLSLLPLLVVVGLWWLASTTREHYERAQARRTDSRTEGADAAHTEPTWPLLAMPAMWQHTSITQATGRLHLSAVALMLSVGTAWHVAFGTGQACMRPATVLSSGCWDQVSGDGASGIAELVVVALGFLLLAAVATLVWIRSEDAVDVMPKEDSPLRRPPALARIFHSSLLLYAAQLVILCLTSGPAWVRSAAGRSASFAADRLLGVSATPAILLAALVAMCLSALTWRFAINRSSTLLGGVCGAAILVSSFDQLPGNPWAALAVAAIAAGIVVMQVIRGGGGISGEVRRYEAWGGCAPGVALVLATMFAFTLSSGVAVVAGNVLNGSYSAASLAGLPAAAAVSTRPTCSLACPTLTAPQLLLPRPYVWWGAGVLLTAIALLSVLAKAWREQRRVAQVAAPTPGMSAAVAQARSLASVAHRAEKVAGALAIAGGASVVLSLVVAVTGWSPNTRPGENMVGGVVGFVLSVGMWSLAGVGIALVGLSAGGAALGNTRPLGIVWDLICFLPRAGHPFGPPCYAERVVPELIGRVGEWLDAEPAPDLEDVPGITRMPGPGRKVILSAHSLGGVLATATVLGSPSPQTWGSSVDRLSLLTHGSQLRTFFSRIFPELLGPAVLGVPPCLAAGLTTHDPWKAEKANTGRPPAPELHDSLRGVLSTRWIGLWRETDYIGFPVFGYPEGDPGTGGTGSGLAQPAASAVVTGSANPVDRRAEEIDRTGYLLAVLTHGDYPRTPAYTRALLELARRP